MNRSLICLITADHLMIRAVAEANNERARAELTRGDSEARSVSAQDFLDEVGAP